MVPLALLHDLVGDPGQCQGQGQQQPSGPAADLDLFLPLWLSLPRQFGFSDQIDPNHAEERVVDPQSAVPEGGIEHSGPDTQSSIAQVDEKGKDQADPHPKIGVLGIVGGQRDRLQPHPEPAPFPHQRHGPNYCGIK